MHWCDRHCSAPIILGEWLCSFRFRYLLLSFLLFSFLTVVYHWRITHTPITVLYVWPAVNERRWVDDYWKEKNIPLYDFKFGDSICTYSLTGQRDHWLNINLSFPYFTHHSFCHLIIFHDLVSCCWLTLIGRTVHIPSESSLTSDQCVKVKCGKAYLLWTATYDGKVLLAASLLQALQFLAFVLLKTFIHMKSDGSSAWRMGAIKSLQDI